MGLASAAGAPRLLAGAMVSSAMQEAQMMRGAEIAGLPTRVFACLCAVCEHAPTCVHADMYHLLEVLSLS